MLPHCASSSFEALSNPYKITGWNCPTRDNEQPSVLSLVYSIDGKHVLASVPIEQQNRFRNRKGTTTQNVLAAINFNLKFTYVLAGWEGSAHDSRILNDALKRPHGFQIPQDARYELRKGFIPPYHGIRYHLQKYSDCPPQNEKELFNLHHASLRSSVERAFTILKRRFRVIDNEPFWDFKTQVNVVLASYILHNHIVDLDPNDTIIQEVDVEAAIQPRNVQITQNSQGSQSYQTTKRKT
ncbi:putative ripening-related protein 6-like [Capsicum annuum]|nr:putative ripening-related protein 6-like [Capsicum annuum]